MPNPHNTPRYWQPKTSWNSPSTGENKLKPQAAHSWQKETKGGIEQALTNNGNIFNSPRIQTYTGTFNVSGSQMLIVFFKGLFNILLWYKLDESLSTGSPFSGKCEVDTFLPSGNLAL